jgi:hypothetical protein
MDAEVYERIRVAIEENPTHGVRMITAVVRRKAKRPVNRKKVHRIIQAERLAGVAEAAGQATARLGLDVACEQTERALGSGRDARLLWSRRLVSPHGDHRLLGPERRRLAAVEDRRREDRGGDVRGRAAQPQDRRCARTTGSFSVRSPS